MSFTEFEHAKVVSVLDAFIEKRRPRPEIRHKVDLAYELEDQSVLIFEKRASWRDSSEIIREHVAKAIYVKRAEEWKVYWHRADGNWHRYEPVPVVLHIDEFCELVEEDKHGAFWG